MVPFLSIRRLIPPLLLLLLHPSNLHSQKLDLPGGQKARFAHYERVIRQGQAGTLRTTITAAAVAFHFRPDWNPAWSLIGVDPFDRATYYGSLEPTQANIFFSCQSDGVVRQYLLDDQLGKIHVISEGRVNFLPDEQVRAILGMGEGLVTTKRIYRRTTGLTEFELDTAGFAGLFSPPRSIPGGIWHGQWAAIAPNGDVYQLRYDWVIRRRAGEDTWSLVARLPTNPATTFGYSIYVDRRYRVYVSGVNRVWWMNNPDAPLTLHDNLVDFYQLHTWQDDAQGNIFALTSSGRLVRSKGGTEPWTLIDQSVLALMGNPSNTSGSVGITESAALVFTSGIGPFVSTDQGDTWSHDLDATYGSTATGLVEPSTGVMVVGTSLGAFVRATPTGTWSKTYPSTGYATIRSLQRDRDGALWIQSSGNTFVASAPVLKSTNGGLSWLMDFQPQSMSAASTFFVSSNGWQYCALSTIDSTFGVMHRRAPGGAWDLDTAGLRPVQTGPPLFGDDGTGTVYVSFRGSADAGLWRRDAASGAWAVDSSGLGRPAVIALTCDKDGRMLAGIQHHGIARREADQWRSMAVPTELGPEVTAVALSVDSLNTLFASFARGDGSSYVPLGTYASKDLGRTWTKIEAGAAAARSIISTASRTYVLTDDGVYGAPTTLVKEFVDDRMSVPARTIVVQAFPNPFNSELSISYFLPEAGHVRLTVIDLLGREVEVLQEGMRDKAQQIVRWMPRESGGIYFLRLTVSGRDGWTVSTAVTKVVYLR